MIPHRQQLEADILQVVRSRFPHHPALTLDTDLLEEGLLDSLLLVDLIFQFEDRYGMQLESDQVSSSNFRTAAAIVNLVDRMRHPDSAASDRGSASTSSHA